MGWGGQGQRHFEGHTLIQIHSNLIPQWLHSSLASTLGKSICWDVNVILATVEEDISVK